MQTFRPTKRPRLAEPEGFVQVKPQSTKVSTPKFSSAFGERPSKAVSAPKVVAIRKPPQPPIAEKRAETSLVASSQRKPPSVIQKENVAPHISASKPLSKSRPLAHSWNLQPSGVPAAPAKALKPLLVIPSLPPALPVTNPDLHSVAAPPPFRDVDQTDRRQSRLLPEAQARAFLLEELPPSTPTNGDCDRGINLSPEKRKAKEKAQFVRGGLADRASEYFHRSRTSLVLWRRDNARVANPRTSGGNVQVRILKIIQHPDSGSRTQGSPGIALCSDTLDDLLLQTVIFQFRPHAESDIAHFCEGAVVQLVAPYHYCARLLDDLPSSATQNVIVCSKFLFVR